ncbi:MAG: hypothetical protein ACYS0I_01690 [Planctomycetota bacterium]
MAVSRIAFKDYSPNREWLLEIHSPTKDATAFYAIFKRPNQEFGNGFPFGFNADPSCISVKWDLPDSVCGIYIKDMCFALFRYGARRRRKREYYRTGKRPFSKKQIAWVCANKHIQKRWKKGKDNSKQ